MKRPFWRTMELILLAAILVYEPTAVEFRRLVHEHSIEIEELV